MKALFSALISVFALSAYAQNPVCPGVHVWYSLSNDSTSAWSVQVARLYENNISFVDENCQALDLNQKLALAPSETRYVGMKVDKETGFYSTYSFMGVKNVLGQNSGMRIPKGVAACAFLVAPYSPGQMDRLDWKLNNADCYADQLGTEMHFK